MQERLFNLLLEGMSGATRAYRKLLRSRSNVALNNPSPQTDDTPLANWDDKHNGKLIKLYKAVPKHRVRSFSFKKMDSQADRFRRRWEKKHKRDYYTGRDLGLSYGDDDI